MSEQDKSEERKKQIRNYRMQLRKTAKMQLFGQDNLEKSLSRSKKIMQQSKNSNMTGSRISDKLSESTKKSNEKKNIKPTSQFKNKQYDISEKYEDLNEILGDGVSGCVKKYRHKINGKIYAVKEIRGHEEKRIQAINTYKLNRKLKHPYICQTYNLYINENLNCLYQTMEYNSDYISLEQYQKKYRRSSSIKAPDQIIQIQNLQKQMNNEDNDKNPNDTQQNQQQDEQQQQQQKQKKRTQLPIDITKKIINSLVEAVHYMHEKGICHRDLKPDNILISKKDPSQIKIIDFGIARSYIKTNPDNQFIKMYLKLTTQTGSLVYKAPEMFSRYFYTQSVDMWSIGVITYQLITGMVPFWHSYKTDTIELIQACKVIYDEEVFPWSKNKVIQDFIYRLLRKEVKQEINDINFLGEQGNQYEMKSGRMTSEEAKIHIWFQNTIPDNQFNNNAKAMQISQQERNNLIQPSTDVNQSTPNVAGNTRHPVMNIMNLKQSQDIFLTKKEQKDPQQQANEIYLLKKKLQMHNGQTNKLFSTNSALIVEQPDEPSPQYQDNTTQNNNFFPKIKSKFMDRLQNGKNRLQLNLGNAIQEPKLNEHPRNDIDLTLSVITQNSQQPAQKVNVQQKQEEIKEPSQNDMSQIIQFYKNQENQFLSQQQEQFKMDSLNENLDQMPIKTLHQSSEEKKFDDMINSVFDNNGSNQNGDNQEGDGDDSNKIQFLNEDMFF